MRSNSLEPFCRSPRTADNSILVKSGLDQSLDVSVERCFVEIGKLDVLSAKSLFVIALPSGKVHGLTKLAVHSVDKDALISNSEPVSVHRHRIVVEQLNDINTWSGRQSHFLMPNV